jgi:hypothetical protein
MDARGGRATSGAARLENGQTFDRPEIKTKRVGNSQATILLEQTPAGRDWAEGEEVTNMDNEDLKLIRQIVASDGRKYTAGNIDRSRYDRLVDLGWLTPFKTNISDVEYRVTEKGRAAAVADD